MVSAHTTTTTYISGGNGGTAKNSSYTRAIGFGSIADFLRLCRCSSQAESRTQVVASLDLSKRRHRMQIIENAFQLTRLLVDTVNCSPCPNLSIKVLL